MNAAPRRIWRPLRSFLILTCVAGAVLAADNTWLSDLRFEFNAADWWSEISPAAMPSADIAIANTPANRNAPELSMGRLFNGLLFAKPTGGWRLDPANTEFASPPTTQQSSAYSTATSWRFGPLRSESPGDCFVTELVSMAPAAVTSTGTWHLNASGTWSSPDNWNGGVVADGAGNTAHFDALNITTNVTVTLDSSRTIGSLYIGDTDGTHSYNIAPQSGSTLTFDDNSTDFQVHSILQQTATSAGDTISANILAKQDLDINNLSATHGFTIAGNIAATGTTGFPILWFNNHDTSTGAAAGNITVSGNISNGTATQLSLVVVTGGIVTLIGTNTYTGFSEVDGGTLLVNGNNSAATGSVYVYPSGTLGGTGTIGGAVNAFGGTVTGATTTTVGTLTLLGDARFTSGEGGGGTYLANLSGALSDLLAITGTLTLGADATLDIVGAADGTTTYILATFNSHTDIFGTVMGVPSGYSLVYNPTDLELVPTAIPEPATWIGGALALGAIVFAWRSRKAALTDARPPPGFQMLRS